MFFFPLSCSSIYLSCLLRLSIVWFVTEEIEQGVCARARIIYFIFFFFYTFPLHFLTVYKKHFFRYAALVFIFYFKEVPGPLIFLVLFIKLYVRVWMKLFFFWVMHVFFYCVQGTCWVRTKALHFSNSFLSVFPFRFPPFRTKWKAVAILKQQILYFFFNFFTLRSVTSSFAQIIRHFIFFLSNGSLQYRHRFQLFLVLSLYEKCQFRCATLLCHA